MTEGTTQTAYLQSFVQGLVDAGVRDAVVCPGSRSTPLTVLLAARAEIHLWMHVDERSAGFFALGMAKASGRSVVLVASSGTATANYYPAVIEASLSGVPLVVLTADRPPELRDVGAPQVIDQVKLFSGYAKLFAEMATAHPGANMQDYALAWGRRAAQSACSDPMGPVHCNFPLRDPLVPEDRVGDDPAGSWPEVASVLVGVRRLDPGRISILRQHLFATARGIMVVGGHPHPNFNRELIALAERLGYPVLADPLSQLRSDGRPSPLLITAYDAFLRNPEIWDWIRPEVIVRFGPMPVSKFLTQALAHWNQVPQILVDPVATWRDPNHARGVRIVEVDPKGFCQDLLGDSEGAPGQAGSDAWMMQWTRLNEAAVNTLAEVREDLWDGSVAAELADLLPSGSLLYVGNSMPIRDLDTFWRMSPGVVRILANRGANGIDGVVSSALGASTTHRPLVLMLGDLSFYHDLGGLLAAKLHRLSATIIVLNNDGGGIFSFLPQARLPRFEELFAVPLGLDFSLAVAMYGGRHFRVTTLSEFRRQVQAGTEGQGLTVIEVVTDRGENRRRHQALWAQVDRATTALKAHWSPPS